jgi:hypothetical protein
MKDQRTNPEILNLELLQAGIASEKFGSTEKFTFGRRRALKMYKALRKAIPAAEDELAKRWEMAQLLKALSVNGVVAIHEWGRDCDMCESDSVRLIYPHYMLFYKAEQDMYDSAEGPCSIYPISKTHADAFEPTFRDRIGEAWDNGNTSPHMV